MIEYNDRECPECHSLNTFKRRGINFEHERVCGKCGQVYDPRVEYQKVLLKEEERQQFVTDRD